MKKSEQIAAMLQERIEHGAYHTGVLPSLRELATELGVNYLTVREGMHLLCDQGIIGTTRNRKFTIRQRALPRTGLRVALLEGAGGANVFIQHLTTAIQSCRGSVRRFIYSYNNDELLTTVPDMNFDLVFFSAAPEALAPMVLNKFIDCKEKLVSISFDYTRYGIRSILEPAIEESVQILYQELRQRNHRRFDIIAPQNTSEIIERRITTFRLCAEEENLVCNTHRYRMADFLFDINIVREAAQTCFHAQLPPEAVFVPTAPHAVGVMRGLYDMGWLAGRDYSLVSCGDRDIAGSVIPAIAITTSEDFLDVFEEIILSPYGEKLKFFLNPPELLPGESLLSPA